MLDYNILYYTVKREKGNVDWNSEENIDTSEHISERLWKMALLGKYSDIPKINRLIQVIMLHQHPYQLGIEAEIR